MECHSGYNNRTIIFSSVLPDSNSNRRPYNFDPLGQGLIFLAPFVGSLVGTYLCGPLSDKIATYYTRRNDGVREPEMRLPTFAIAAVFVWVGVVIAAVTYHYKTQYMGPIVGLGVMSAGTQICATLAMTYAVDCHQDVCF
jgi:MFS family permease